MLATKQQIIKGLTSYILSDVVNSVPDITLKIALSAAAKTAARNPEQLTALLFDSQIGKMLFIPDENDCIDTEAALGAIAESIQQYGRFTVTIPAVPLLSKGEQVMSFTADDINKLRSHIERCSNGYA